MILVLDDEPGVVVAFGGVLRRMSVSYHAAGTVAEATALLPEYSWLAFVFDLELPDGSGIDLLEWVRSHPQWQNTPTAVVTASILLDDRTVHRIGAAGARLHCGAFTGPDIEAILRELLNGR